VFCCEKDIYDKVELHTVVGVNVTSTFHSSKNGGYSLFTFHLVINDGNIYSRPFKFVFI
jgi:hypothetical protein